MWEVTTMYYYNSKYDYAPLVLPIIKLTTYNQTWRSIVNVKYFSKIINSTLKR